MPDCHEPTRKGGKTKELTRQCALTRANLPVDQLVRFALGPDGNIVPDIDAKAPGRGVWISFDYEAVAQAAQKNVFARSLKHKVHVPQDLAQITRTRLEQRLSGALGLARKAGQLQTGATRVKSVIGDATIIALFTASNGAPDGRRKMMMALRSSGLEEEVPSFDILSSELLGLALGQENVIHAALTKGAAGKSALLRAQNLARYMAQTNEQPRLNERDDIL
jgi:uncharacterized protein